MPECFGGTPWSALHTQDRTCEFYSVASGHKDTDGSTGEAPRRGTSGQQHSHRDVKYSVGAIVSNIEILLYGHRWVLDLGGSQSLRKFISI